MDPGALGAQQFMELRLRPLKGSTKHITKKKSLKNPDLAHTPTVAAIVEKKLQLVGAVDFL